MNIQSFPVVQDSLHGFVWPGRPKLRMDLRGFQVYMLFMCIYTYAHILDISTLHINQNGCKYNEQI